jgi:2-methylisocitrate lyase-like PEP mutase family enzyme
MKMTTRLRELIERKKILVVPGAYDAMSAKLIEVVGFDAAYMSGFGVAASCFGFPDIGLLSMTEMAETAKRMASQINIPLIADADTGYGNHLNIFRTMEEYESSGVAGIQIEDQISPKRCGHMEGHNIVPVEEMAAKIRAAVTARKNPDMIIIARTDAISAEGFDEAIRRGNIYREEGADVVFIEAPTTIDQLRKIPILIDAPVLVNVAPKTPYLPSEEYEEMGFSIVIYPPLSLTTAYKAIKDKLMELKMSGTMKDGGHGGVPFDELVDFLGLTKYREVEKKLLNNRMC